MSQIPLRWQGGSGGTVAPDIYVCVCLCVCRCSWTCGSGDPLKRFVYHKGPLAEQRIASWLTILNTLVGRPEQVLANRRIGIYDTCPSCGRDVNYNSIINLISRRLMSSHSRTIACQKPSRSRREGLGIAGRCRPALRQRHAGFVGRPVTHRRQ